MDDPVRVQGRLVFTIVFIDRTGNIEACFHARVGGKNNERTAGFVAKIWTEYGRTDGRTDAAQKGVADPWDDV